MGGHDTIANEPLSEPEHSSDDHAREIVATLQRTLLNPRVPDTPGLGIDRRYRLGPDGARCGGDWYDVVALNDGRLLLVVGDVVGYGAVAAATMGRMRLALEIYASEGFTPRQMLERLNRHTVEGATGEVATILVIVLDVGSGRGTMASAGHPPPIVRDANGSATLVDVVGGPPVGATVRGHFVDQPLTVAAGSTLVLYTDGLVERRGEDLGVGIARLTRAIADGPAGAAPLADFVLATCDSAARNDDLALLVVASDMEVAPFHLELPARPRVLPTMRNALAQWMARADVGEANASDILLAVNEAVANAIEHAYGPGDGAVNVDVERDGDDVRVCVRDRGRWRPTRAVGGGLGMGLMRQLVDDVVIDSTAEGTTVAFRVTVEP